MWHTSTKMLLMAIYCPYALLSRRWLHNFSCSLELTVGNNHISNKIAIKYWKMRFSDIFFFLPHMGKESRECECYGSIVDIQFTEKVTSFFLFSAQHLIDYTSLFHTKQLKGNVYQTVVG